MEVVAFIGCVLLVVLIQGGVWYAGVSGFVRTEYEPWVGRWVCWSHNWRCTGWGDTPEEARADYRRKWGK